MRGTGWGGGPGHRTRLQPTWLCPRLLTLPQLRCSQPYGHALTHPPTHTPPRGSPDFLSSHPCPFPHRIKMQGFIVSTLAKGMEVEFARDMADYVTGGKVKVRRWPAAERGRRQQRGLRLATAPPAAAAPHRGYTLGCPWLLPNPQRAGSWACKPGLYALAATGDVRSRTSLIIALRPTVFPCIHCALPHLHRRGPVWVSPGRPALPPHTCASRSWST